MRHLHRARGSIGGEKLPAPLSSHPQGNRFPSRATHRFFMPDFDVTEILQQPVLVFHIPAALVDVPLSEAITCAVSARRTLRNPTPSPGEIVPIRHLLAQGDDAVALYDDHTFLARLFHGVVHQQAILIGRGHQTAKRFPGETTHPHP